ncbi:MAG: homoserine kinase [Alphaproteobacteria bacterium]|nr:homoserine kinase [Alphaproteobacteria bacterium]
MAVYTQISTESLEDFIKGYDIGPLISHKAIVEGVENTNYFVRTQNGPCILTLYEKRVDPEDIPFFLSLMAHLAQKETLCPFPIPNRQGELSGTLANRPAALFSFLDGMSVCVPQTEHCAALGRLLARFHNDAADFEGKRRNTLSVQDWPSLFRKCGSNPNQICSNLSDEINHELVYLKQQWPQDLPVGIIHADLFPDNVFFIGKNIVGLIDFCFACNDILAYDIAICINAWCFENNETLNFEKSRSLLEAYAQIRPLGADEKRALPLLMRGAALRFMLTRLFDWIHKTDNVYVTHKDPDEYLKKLRFLRNTDKIHNNRFI